MPHLSPPAYSADGGGGAAASVITENCCVGGNRCVNSAMTEWRAECVCLCVCLCLCTEWGFNMQPKTARLMLWIRSIWGSFRKCPAHTSCQLCESCLAQSEPSLTSAHHSVPYADGRVRPVSWHWLGTKPPERKNFNFFFFWIFSFVLKRLLTATMISVSKRRHSRGYERGLKENVTFPRCVLSHGNHGN